MIESKKISIKTKSNLILIGINLIILLLILSFYFNLNNFILINYKQIINFSAFILLFMVIQTILLNTFVINPVIKLHDGIIKSKNKDIHLKFQQNDEIGKIAKEFNNLHDIIKNRNITLRKSERTRTAKLELKCQELEELHLQNLKKEQFLETLFETIPFPIFYKNEHFRYIRCNNAFSRFLGRSKGDIYGKTVFDLAPQDLAKQYHSKDEDLFESGDIQVYESFVEDLHGNSKSVVFKKSICKLEDKKIGIVGVITDMNELNNFFDSLDN